MKNQIPLSSRSEARRGNARSIICHRGGAWPALLLAACCAVLSGLAHPTGAAVTEVWVHRYNNVVSNSTDKAFAVVSDAAGDFIVTGYTDDGTNGRDMLTIKYSGANGSVLWQKRYNGPDNDNDEARAVAVDGSGNVVVTGYSGNVYLGNSSMDYYTAKYAAADGALLWEKRYNGPTNGDDQATAVAVDGGGNVVVTGFSYTDRGDRDFYTAKYAAADGALVWEKRFNGIASAVAVDGSGNVVVTGYSGNGIDVDGNSTYDFYTAKYAAADGAPLWERRYSGLSLGIGFNDHERMANFLRGHAKGLAIDPNGNVVMTDGYSYTAKYAAANGALLWEKRDIGASAVAVDGSGNVVMTGSSGNGTNSDYYTAKYAAADGSLLWEKRYDGGGVAGYLSERLGQINGPENNRDEGRAVAVDGSGNVVVTGVSGWAAGGILWPSRFDFYTAKYASADGTLLWEKRYDGAETEGFYLPPMAVAVDRSGNVVLTGAPFSSESDTDYYTAKYAAADGVLLWEKRYSGPANREDSARAVAVDGTGNVVVTGSSIGSVYNADFYTAKYAAANGALLWEKRYNGGAYFGEGAKAMALDGSGNVVVTGASQGDFYTAKYAATDGALLWEKRLSHASGAFGGGNAVALDDSGNVMVTGSSQGVFYTAKYAAADGALLWEKRYTNGLANAVAVDSSGNFVVTGFSYGSGGNVDYYTAKYAAADGALLWERRYNGPANQYDYAYAVAVDGSGNVVVTGYSYTDRGGRDFYTAKYAAADGALLWEKRYNGPANLDDVASAVAMDGSGNVVVTGYSFNGTNYDYYTAKYAAADGALLWETRSSGGGQAVAVDGSGNVVVTGGYYDGINGYGYYTAKYAAADGTLLWEIRYSGGLATSLALGPNGMVVITGSSGGDYATVVYRETLPPLAIERVPTGIRLRFTAVPGSSYTIERASAITGPWTTINMQTAPLDGLFGYIDTNPPVATAFYRTVQP